ncbi:hypothetical protein LTR91_003617 [Friedmanniomyces endolithicus]|uniref:Transmembrane protein n=1 Tax=Friedmanniomyces endolithicus TaxID=329885 RepID=A0AAN6KZB5_9PEZI|nr:hypothetical protein LTR57_000126 [Friedmanniomyces endolithicus]KAK1007007.1 hypothetical protein LTR91_003617 [Friedmanniomyces endolithicus]KAK1013849.1 hypothetical protein LTS01_000377 [Friedmanniomyces endolithicus]KAK1032336.1 hypothetical protein LTS16_017269 [Friedmanniomyces endolithicus]
MPLRVPFIDDGRQPRELPNPAAMASPTAAPRRISREGVKTATKARRPNPRTTTGERKGIPSKYWQPATLPPTMKGFEVGHEAFFTTMPVAPRPAAIAPTSDPLGESVSQPATTQSQATVNSAKMRGDELPELPRWWIGLLAGLLSFGLTVAVVLYLANFPPKWEWWHRRRNHTLPQRRKKGGYAKVNSEDESSADEKRGRRKLALRSPEAVGLGISYTSSTAAGAGLASRRRKNLSVDTSGRYGGLGAAVSGTHNVAARKEDGMRRDWRSRSYDEERLQHREPPPLSPVRFAWEALTAPIPSIAGFSALLGGSGRGGRSGARSMSMMSGLGYERETEVEGGRYSPCFGSKVETNVFRTPAKVAVPGIRSANVFGRIGESVERAAATLGGLLSDTMDGSAEQGLLLPVRDSERERGYEPALRAVV